MLRITNLSLLSFILFALAACASNQPSSNISTPVVTDTLGVQFAVSCSGFYCSLTSSDPNEVPTSCDGAYGTDTFALVWAKILAVHVVNVPTSGTIQVNAAEPGHPVVCASDADCYSPGMDSYGNGAVYACQYGLCQATQMCFGGKCQTPPALTTNDVITLCQADIPWPKSCPYITSQPFANRMVEVAASCGSNTYCTNVPSDCRQPVAPSTPDGGI
jgi:hypothetical protein